MKSQTSTPMLTIINMLLPRNLNAYIDIIKCYIALQVIVHCYWIIKTRQITRIKISLNTITSYI